MDLAMAGAGALAGLLCGWFGAWAWLRERCDRALREAAARAAGAAGEAVFLRAEAELGKRELGELQRALREAVAARAAADARAAEIERAAVQQHALLKDAEAALANVFKSLAADALGNNNRQFLLLAGENLAALEARAAADLAGRQRAIEGVVSPVQQSLERMDEQIRAMEAARGEAYGALSAQLQSLTQSQTDLRNQTANLVKALRTPAVRGRWGEIQLKRVVEIAGLLDHCDFLEQQSYQGPEGRLRPDMRVLLPGGRNIIIDAKAPLEAYLASLEAPSEERRLACLRDHARQVGDHVARLAAKSYWEHLVPTPEFVVLFLPGETFFSAALEQEPSLIERGVNQHVILATPTTLIALLRAVAYGWRHEQLADNAQRISQLGQELYERLMTTAGHLGALGSSLTSCIDKYNRAVGSLESRVLSAARRFKELGVSASGEIPSLEPLQLVAREPACGLAQHDSRSESR